MNKHILSPFFNAALVLALILGAALPALPALAQEPVAEAGPEPDSATEEIKTGSLQPEPNPRLNADILEPPENCHVVANASFGQDLEILMGPLGSGALRRVDQTPSWSTVAPILYWGAGSIAAVAVGPDTVVAAGRYGTSNSLAMATWKAGEGWSNYYSADLDIKGSPALLSKSPNHFALFGRATNNCIKVMQWNAPFDWSDWQQVACQAASDPAVVSRDSHHMAVFFKASDGDIKFTEWRPGGWRTEPISLGNPSGAQIASELSVVSRNENHVAVFGVGDDNALYMREWTSKNASDWSDTAWTSVIANVQIGKPGVVSLNSNHMAVAVMRTADPPYVTLREWTFSSGWRTKWNLGRKDFGAHPTLAAKSGEELWILGVGKDKVLYGGQWTNDEQWSGWTAFEVGWRPNQTLGTAVRQSHDLMLFGQPAAGGGTVEIKFKHYTAQSRPLTKTSLGVVSTGLARGQIVATVDNETVWVSAARSGTGKWRLRAIAPATDASGGVILSHSDSGMATGHVDVAAGDLDLDGDDEVVVVTLDQNGAKIDISVVELGLIEDVYYDPVLGWQDVIEMSPSLTSYSNRRFGYVRDINVAVGNLDDDDRQDDIVIAWVWSDIATLVYEYTDTGLQLRPGKDYDYAWVGRASGDIEITLGAVRAFNPLYPGQQLVASAQGMDLLDHRPPVYVASWKNGQWILHKSAVVPTPYEPFGRYGAEGEYSTALATADVDGDMIEEIVHSERTRLTVLNADGTGRFFDDLQDAWYDDEELKYATDRSITVGDLDFDGQAEILHAAGGSLQILQHRDPRLEDTYIGQLIATGSLTIQGVPMLADVDRDSNRADLVGCANFSDVKVTAVVNGPPRYVDEEGISLHDGGMEVANSTTASTAEEDGWHAEAGASLSVGFEHEFDVPILAIKVGEVWGKVTVEFMRTWGGATGTEESTTTAQGHTRGGSTRGMVLYNKTEYRCYYYDVYEPNAPEDKSRAMTCTPSSQPSEIAEGLETWHSTTKTEAGDSWVDLGRAGSLAPGLTDAERHSNDVYSYPDSLPVDYFLTTWHDSTMRLTVSGEATEETTEHFWSIEDSTTEYQVESGSWDLACIIAGGFKAMDVTVDASVTGGGGKDWSRTTSWTENLAMGGSVSNFFEDDCPGCLDYGVQPYVWEATAVSLAGDTYPYLEVDYYVPNPPGRLAASSTPQRAAPQSVALAPWTPIITCTTHPISTTWYPTSTVTFEWDQPAGDPAQVTGYWWNLAHSELITPNSARTLTATTHTYEDVADGVYTLSLWARGDGGDYSPTAYRQVRVDTNPPQVELVPDPLAPTGMGGWYNTPVTVTASATDTAGSGVETVEYCVDSGAWQTYTTPIAFVTDTLTTTLWARATDGVGHTSDPVSVTLKLDLTPPSSYDLDGNRLTYANIITDDMGNLQLVLGGALSDTLSGRLMMEVKASDDTSWRQVSAVGEFPIPPGNDLVTTDTVSLNWIYTPTYEIRGVYPLRGRGLDRAGNYEVFEDEKLEIFGVLWWEPDDTPDLAESLVSLTPGEVYPGDTVTFTLGVRNTGYQEAQIALTDTLPAELTVLPDTIGGGGQYDADSGTITWTLHALWPGETRYLFFSAQVDEGLTLAESLTLENRLDVMGYWPWGEELPEVQPYLPSKPEGHSAVATTTLTVLTGTATSTSAPTIFAADVLEGAVVDDPQVTLFVDASPDAEFLYVKEWVWDTVSDTWMLAQESGWVAFEEADGFEVSESAISKQGRYQWMLSEGDGVKHLGVWVADAEQRMTNLNDANLIYTNLMGAGGQSLDAGERVQYRVPLRADDLTIFNLVTLSGDADLYVWKPRFAFRPHYLSNADEIGFHVETIGFFVEEEGMHIVEVEGVTDGTTYRLSLTGDIPGATRNTPSALLRAGYEALPQGVHIPLQEKERPAHPLILSTPYGLEDAQVLPEAPKAPPEEPMGYAVYLPLVMRSE